MHSDSRCGLREAEGGSIHSLRKGPKKMQEMFQLGSVSGWGSKIELPPSLYESIVGLVASANTSPISFLVGELVRREASRPVRIVPFELLVRVVLAGWGQRNLLSANLAT